jgi:protein-S-isoprenylcysteine O-methyltransferase Ste14
MTSRLYVLSISLFIILSCVVFRVVIRRSYRLHRRLTPISVVLQGLIFFSWGALTWAELPAGWPSNPIVPALRIAGWTLLVVGLTSMIALIAWFDLRRAAGWRVCGLVRRGPYTFTRNPQILACILGAVGYVLLWLSLHSIGWLVALIVATHMMVLTEEEHLRRVFGSEYQEYCEQIPRYIGVLRRKDTPAA